MAAYSAYLISTGGSYKPRHTWQFMGKEKLD